MALIGFGAFLFVSGAVAVFSPLVLVALAAASIGSVLSDQPLPDQAVAVIIVAGPIAMMIGLTLMLGGTVQLVKEQRPQVKVNTDAIAIAVTQAMEPAVEAIKNLTVSEPTETVKTAPEIDEAMMVEARRRLVAELANQVGVGEMS